MPPMRGTRYAIAAAHANGSVQDLAPLGLGLGISPSLMPTPQPVEEPDEVARLETPQSPSGLPGSEEEPTEPVRAT